MERENQTEQAEQKQQELTHSEEELREIFNYLKEHSYAELSNVTELFTGKEKVSVMLHHSLSICSSILTESIIINGQKML